MPLANIWTVLSNAFTCFCQILYGGVLGCQLLTVNQLAAENIFARSHMSVYRLEVSEVKN